MTETANQPKFQCDACGRWHQWRADLVGTTITCQCLEPVAVPAQPEGELYDMAPVPAEPIRAATPIPPTAASAVLAYQRPIEPAIEEGYSEANPLVASVTKDLVVPIALILVGTVAQFVWRYRLGGSVSHSLMGIGSDFVMNVLVMLLGVIAAARILSVTFGPVPTAVLKLGAIAVGPGGLAVIVAGLLGGGIVGGLAGMIAALAAYFALFSYLFDLDVEEVWQTVMIVFGVRFVSGIFLAAVF